MHVVDRQEFGNPGFVKLSSGLYWSERRVQMRLCAAERQCISIAELRWIKQTYCCSSPGDTAENVPCLKCTKPSPQPQALPLGDGSAAQSCHSAAPRRLGGLARSSSSGLPEKINSLGYKTAITWRKHPAPPPKKQFVLSVCMCHIWTGTWGWGSNVFYKTTLRACRRITSSPDNKISLGWEWPQAAYRRSGQSPCGSWRSPGGSRRRTGTSNPPGHESPPPAGGRRWSSPHGSSALQTRWLIA